MRAIVIKRYGDPDVLSIEERPDPKPQPGHVLIEVKAFGVNHAETHMREGKWPEATEISGIECAGLVKADPDGRLVPGQKVVAFMGGMGRSINGSYAELTSVPAGNVLPVKTELAWDALAAIPESYATAWAALYGNLDLKAGQTIVIRGATSALGQAAVNIAAHAGARVIATTRNPKRAETLETLGAKEVVLQASDDGLHGNLGCRKRRRRNTSLSLRSSAANRRRTVRRPSHLRHLRLRLKNLHPRRSVRPRPREQNRSSRPPRCDDPPRRLATVLRYPAR